MSNSAQEVVARVTETTPHVAGAGLILAGVSLNDWYLMLASGFVLLQAGYFVWTKIIKPYREKRRGRNK